MRQTFSVGILIVTATVYYILMQGFWSGSYEVLWLSGWFVIPTTLSLVTYWGLYEY